MNSIISDSKLIFFKTEMHKYRNNNTVDTSSCPRPHFCMGLILEGSAVFTDCIEKKEITVLKGDIIFVPISSRYISRWSGNPDVTYISMHFIFDYPATFSRHNNFSLQKIHTDNFEKMKGRQYNCGLSDANLSKLELCEKIKKHIPSFMYLEAPIGTDPDKRNYLVSNERLESMGWKPKYTIDDGIEELIKAYSIIKNNIYGNV